MSTEKSYAPAYVSPKSLETFIIQRREDGHITDVVDKSLMRNFSGSTQNELLSALKFLKLVNDKGQPTQLYREIITETDEAAQKKLMEKALREAYGFVFDAPGFSLERGTTFQLSELFKKQGASGSTMVRGIAFFLSMAKSVGIPISPNVKAPSVPRGSRPAKRPKPNGVGVVAEEEEVEEEEDDDSPEGTMRFELPFPVDRKVRITIPADFNSDDWELLQTMFAAYVKRWQAMGVSHKDKGPTPEKE